MQRRRQHKSMSPELKILFCCHHRERHDKRCLAAAALSERLKLVAVGERVDGSNNDELCGARRLNARRSHVCGTHTLRTRLSTRPSYSSVTKGKLTHWAHTEEGLDQLAGPGGGHPPPGVHKPRGKRNCERPRTAGSTTTTDHHTTLRNPLYRTHRATNHHGTPQPGRNSVTEERRRVLGAAGPAESSFLPP